jgi:RHS repeat-associated protein
LIANGPYGTISYTYDNVGNRLARTIDAEIESYSYVPGTNKLNEITGLNAKIFSYDLNGNTTTIGDMTLVYDQNNRLIRAEQNGTILGEYIYNGLGQRVKKVVDGVTTIFFYDFNGNIIAEGLSDGTITAEYLYSGSNRLAKVDVSTGDIYNYLNNYLGTPQLLTDENGVMAWKAKYMPFGEVRLHSLTSQENNFRFPGQYYDQETGLHYNYHRYYDPETGRYLTPDSSLQLYPAGGDVQYAVPFLLETPQELHEYVYVQNNPIINYDRYGLQTCPSRERCIKNAVKTRKVCTRVAWASQGICTAACAAGCAFVPGYLECFIPCSAGCHTAFATVRGTCWVVFFAQLHTCYAIKCDDKCEK